MHGPTTVHTVILTNRDDCTYAIVNPNNTGAISVKYDMRSTRDDVLLTDRIKLFYYFWNKQKPDPICAGHVHLLELATLIRDGGELSVRANFKENIVTMSIDRDAESAQRMHDAITRLFQTNKITRSVLGQSAQHMETIERLCVHMQSSMPEKMTISKVNGGSMFMQLESSHIMENERTIYPLYHLDFHMPHCMPPYLAPYLVLSTLHSMGVTIEQVLKMRSRKLLNFIAAYAQTPMRSPRAVPYTSDNTLTDDPNAGEKAVLSEVFKRSWSYPFKEGALLADDCEGYAQLMQNLVYHLAYMHKNYTDDINSADMGRYTTLMKQCFPEALFQTTVDYNKRLMNLMLHLGEQIANKRIACHIVLGTANGASAETYASAPTLSGHAYACLINNDPEDPCSAILEGTACSIDDQTPKMLFVNGGYLPTSDVANYLTYNVGFNTFTGKEHKDMRLAMHITHDKGSFYKGAFLQNGILLASVRPEHSLMEEGCDYKHPGKENLLYGVDIEHLTDDSRKVYLPVTGTIFQNKEFERLKEYVVQRQVEIHPPFVDHAYLMNSLKWARLPPFRSVEHLQTNRTYTTCMMHVCADQTLSTEALLARLTEEAAKFNASENNRALGIMHAFPCMDGATKVLYMFTDETSELEARLSRQKQ